MIIIIFAAGIYLIYIGGAMKVQNFLSGFLYKFVPIALGAFTVGYTFRRTMEFIGNLF